MKQAFLCPKSSSLQLPFFQMQPFFYIKTDFFSIFFPQSQEKEKKNFTNFHLLKTHLFHNILTINKMEIKHR